MPANNTEEPAPFPQRYTSLLAGCETISLATTVGRTPLTRCSVWRRRRGMSSLTPNLVSASHTCPLPAKAVCRGTEMPSRSSSS